MSQNSKTSQHLVSRMNELQSRINGISYLNQIEQQVVAQINRNSIRLDQIIEAVKKMVKSGEIKVGKKKERDTSVTPNKSQSNKLMDRVEKLLAQSNNQNNIKYIK